MANVTHWASRWAVILVIVVPTAQAQTPASITNPVVGQESGGISLARAISEALKKNPDIQISETRITINKGALQAAGGTFDPLLSASTTVANTSDKIRTTTSSIGVQQQLRNGLTLGSSLTSQSQNIFDSPPAGSTATVGVSIGFPLLRGRGEYLTTAAQNIAQQTLKKSEYDMRHAASVVIYATALAYWNLRAAEEILQAQIESEARAQRLVADIQRLIQSGERPAADIHLINASLTAKNVARLSAEQGLISARLVLSEKIGLDYTNFNEATRTSDTFPDRAEKTALIENRSMLVQQAMDNRFDLKSSQVSQDALRISVDAAKDNLRPILGLTVGANYSGSVTTENPLLVLGKRTGEPQLTVGLTYTWDVVNSKSKGNLLSQSALYDQQTIAVRALQLSIGTGVESAVADYNRSIQQLAQSQYMVSLYTQIVENEKTKLKMAGSTLLDLVNVENQRQDALLNHISQRAAYASAIAALRYQMGELILDGQDTQVLSMDQLRSYLPAAAAIQR